MLRPSTPVVLVEPLPWAAVTTPSVPWQPLALLRLALVELVAVVVIVVAAYQGTNQSDVQDALTWLVVAGAGLVLGGVAAVTWIVAARTAVHIRRSHCDAAIARALDELRLLGVHVNMQGDGAVGQVLHVRGTARYHLPTCVLVAGRAAKAGRAESFKPKGIVACEVCRP